MYDNKDGIQTALLAALDTGEYNVDDSLAELEELAKSAGAEVVGKMTQKKDRPDPGTLFGSGRLQEIAQFVKANEISIVIVDQELSPAQQKNMEKEIDTAVIDRTALILDIFAQRAKTSEGRLQVELAQLKYRMPRLSGLGTSLSRLGGGIGTRGPGESKLESDRRHIRRRLHALEEQLHELEKRRGLLHSRRKKDDVVTVAIVGYTNVGKSTLLNTLTDAGVLAKDMLFATLDPTSRALLLPDGRKVMLVDTVGLVNRLPHHLVQAFKSTLEEATNADLILNVCDASSPEFDKQLEITTSILKDLGAEQVPVLTVLNKCDRLPSMPLDLDRKNAVISAKTGYGLDKLLEKVALNLPETHRRLSLLMPYSEGALTSEIRETGKIYTEEFRENGVYLNANVDIKLCSRLQEYTV